MDGTFRKNERDIANYLNGVKRPSVDSATESASEPKAEPAKRPKISESLQVDNKTTAPPSNDVDEDRIVAAAVTADRRDENSDNGAHAHPPRVSAGNSIPVKKYEPKVPPSNRQTRSTARRVDPPEPATVVCDDDDDGNAAKDHTPKPPAGKSERWEKPLVYPRFGKKKAEVDTQDRERLRSDEFLNDNLIGFYMRFLEDHLDRTNKETAKRVYFFNSYFYATLTNNPKNKKLINYEGVQKWTRSVDIFSYDYIVVPINEAAHWYVAIICNLPNLQRISRAGSETEADQAKDSQEPPAKFEGEVQAVPETPVSSQEGTQGQGAESHKADPGPAKEETARESMAAMTLDDKTEPSKNVAQEAPASDEDWPEKEENPTTSPVRFTSPPKTRSGAQQADAPKPAASPKKSRKSKRKSRGGRDGRDPQDPIIITFDSLDSARAPTIRNLRLYLAEEAKSKKGVEIDTTLVGGLRARSIPLQSNYSDCGLYLLAYVEKFVQDPNRFVSKLLRGKMNEHMDWPPLTPGVLRLRLRRFLDDLYDEQEQLSHDEVGEKRVMADMRPVSFLLGEWGKPIVNAEEGPKPNPDATETKLSLQPDKTSLQPEKATEPAPDPLPPPESTKSAVPETKVSVTSATKPLPLSLSPGASARTFRIPDAVQSLSLDPAQRNKQGAGGDKVEVPDSQEPEPGVLDLTSPQKKTGSQPPVFKSETKDSKDAVIVGDDDVAVEVNPPPPTDGGKEVQVQISGTPPPPPEETKSSKKKKKRRLNTVVNT